MGLKAVEAISQFYLGQSLYPSKKVNNNPIEDPLLALWESHFATFRAPLLLFSAIAPFSTALQSFGYRPLSAWQGRIIYLSPLVLKGVELVLPEDQKGKVNAASQNYHRVVQVALTLAILRISQKEGYHHALGAVSGVSYVYLCRHGYLSAEQKRVVSCAVIILSGGMEFQEAPLLRGKVLVLITTTVSFSLSLLVPEVEAAMMNFFIEAQKAKVDDDDDSFYAVFARDFQKLLAGDLQNLGNNEPSIEKKEGSSLDEVD
ncbi:MAG: hypothetical protein KFB93_06030 [Simkaniaceae bacterium]|nr:MAG: hypothetical protein KFB93_06030 [Simkaniaceae bacterium]